MSEFLGSVFLALILACAIGALVARDLMAAVIIFAAFSFFAAVLFAVFGAVDVALTEAAVGGAIATLFFVSALSRIGERAER
jgi:uncharacterized MnhB-related membrane protein